jgi:hypothetical protein
MYNSCQAPNVFSIFTGDAKTMNLRALYAGTFIPLDLTSCTAIKVSLPNADGTFLTLSILSGAVSISSPANLGAFTASITSDESALLNVGELQSFNVTFTISGSPFTVPYLNSFSVFEID